MSLPIQSPAKIPSSDKKKLSSKYAFYYRVSEDFHSQQKGPINTKDYENQIIKIGEFDTVEDFWAIFQHLRKPDSCKPGIEFQLFRNPIKPIWEDDNNKNGGRISIKLRKDFTTIIWEEMIFAFIGDVLQEKIKNEINGIVVTSRREFNTLQIWFKNWNLEKNNIIDNYIRDLLQIPPEVNLDFKKFNKEDSEETK